MKLYYLYFGNPAQHYYSYNKEEILQIANNQIIQNLRSISQSLNCISPHLKQEILKSYIELKNNNIEKAIEIWSNAYVYHYVIKYWVEEPLSIKNLPKDIIKLFDDEIKKDIFK